MNIPLKNPRLVFLNVFLFTLLGSLFGVLQSSLWFLILKDKINPPLWILGLSYLTLYRTPSQGLLWTYVYGLCLYAMTVAPFSRLFCLLLGVFVFIQVVKKYFFQTGGAYFFLIVVCASLFYELFYFVFSFIVYNEGFSSFYFFYLFLHFFTPILFCLPFYRLMTFIDRVTQQEPLPEAKNTF